MPFASTEFADRQPARNWMNATFGTEMRGGPDPGRQPVPVRPVDPAVAASRATMGRLVGEFQPLIRELQQVRGGDAIVAEAAACERGFAAIGDNDAAGAQAALELYRNCIKRADDLCEGERARRAEIAGPLDAKYHSQPIDELLRSLPLLPDAAKLLQPATSAAEGIRKVKSDRRLSVTDGHADDFDAAVKAYQEAGALWEQATMGLSDAVAAERQRRQSAMEALKDRSGKAQEALKKSIAAVNDKEPKISPAAENYRTGRDKVIPAWLKKDELLKTLKAVPPAGMADKPYADFSSDMESGSAQCKAAETLAADLAAWQKNYTETAASAKNAQKGAEETVAAHRAVVGKGSMAALIIISEALRNGEFDKAKAAIGDYKKTMEGVGEVGAVTADTAWANGGRQLCLGAVGTALLTGDYAGAAKAIDGFKDRLAKAPALAGCLPDLLKNWPQIAKSKPIARLPVQVAAISKMAERLKAQQPTQAGLVEDAGQYEGARAFADAVGSVDNLVKAVGSYDEAAFALTSQRTQPMPDYFVAQHKRIIESADPQSDPTFRTAIAQLADLTKQAEDAAERRKDLINLGSFIDEQLGGGSEAADKLRRQADRVKIEAGAAAQQEIARIRAVAQQLGVDNEQLTKVIAAGRAGLGASQLAATSLGRLRMRAERAIAAQIDGAGSGVAGALDELKNAYSSVAVFLTRHGDATKAKPSGSPAELVSSISASLETATLKADLLQFDEANKALLSAERLTAIVRANAAIFEKAEAVMESGPAAEAKSMTAKHREAIQAALQWTGEGAAFAPELARILGDLTSALKSAYQEQRGKRPEAAAVQQRAAIANAYAGFPDHPTPPADPVPLLQAIDQQAKNDELGALRRLASEIDPLYKSIQEQHKLLPKITSYYNDWAASEIAYANAVNRLGTSPAVKSILAVLEGYKNKADAGYRSRLVDPDEAQDRLADLVARVKEVAAWKGPMPNATPSRTKAYDRASDVSAEAYKLINNGGLTIGAVESLVPVGTANNFVPSINNPRGFKFEFVAKDGKPIIVWGHGPSAGPGVDPDSMSAQGNIVRVKIDNKFLQTDQKQGFSMVSKNDEGHIPLLGNPT